MIEIWKRIRRRLPCRINDRVVMLSNPWHTTCVVVVVSHMYCSPPKKNSLMWFLPVSPCIPHFHPTPHIYLFVLLHSFYSIFNQPCPISQSHYYLAIQCTPPSLPLWVIAPPPSPFGSYHHPPRPHPTPICSAISKFPLLPGRLPDATRFWSVTTF